jgi:hypothetical protein
MSSNSLSKFASEINSRGVAKQSLFMVEIVPPPFYSTPIDESFIPLFCEQSQFPEIVMATATIKDNGINREAVYDKLYGNLSMLFACDQNMIIKSFFDRWSTGVVMSTGGVFAYPTEYTSPWINIHQLNNNMDVVYSVRIYNCYPKVVNDIILTASSKDYNRFQVSFAYEKWESITTVMTSEYIKELLSTGNADSVRRGSIKAAAGMMTGEYNNGSNNTNYSKYKLNSLQGRIKGNIDNFTDWTGK